MHVGAAIQDQRACWEAMGGLSERSNFGLRDSCELVVNPSIVLTNS